jgi:hypothetical protein
MATTSHILPNLPPITWGMKDITFAGALEAATAITSNPWSYQDILGITGLAYRTRWYLTGDERGWDGAAPIAEEREEIALFAGSGWRLRLAAVDVAQPTLVELALNPQVTTSAPVSRPQPNGEALQFRDAIIESIDAGLPVLCKDRTSLDMSVVYGYEDDGDVVVMNDYWGVDNRLPLAEMWPFFLILTPGEPVEPMVAAKHGLVQAVYNWRRESISANSINLWGDHPPSATYLYGDQAYARWIADLEDVSDLDAQQQGQLFHASWWNLDCWFSARHYAQSYLQELAAQMEGETATALMRAAGYYQEQCRQFHATVPPHGHGMAFLGPWTGKGIAQWNDEVRANEREFLTVARELDTLATAELEAALATWPEL